MPRVVKSPPQIKIDKFVPSKKQQLQGQHQLQNKMSQDNMTTREREEIEHRVQEKDKLEDAATRKKVEEIKVLQQEVEMKKEEQEEELKSERDTSSVKSIAVEEKDMIEKSEGEFCI